jgi:TetR/AcrR family transcriptional regulator, transcriptional repressor for nem operon
MPRAKEFDETEVLDRALDLFRVRGFKHTSFEDLTRELGVSRQSLYDTYGDKSTLYHAALNRYLARAGEYLGRTLADPSPIRQVMAAFFEAIILNSGACGSSGCLMVNAMVELSPHDPETRVLAQAHARSIEGSLASRLAAAQRKGEIAKSKDPVALARYFYHTILGLSVASRAFGEEASLRATAAMSLNLLD